VYWKSWPLGTGGRPTCPAATWTFCSRKHLDDVAGRQVARLQRVRVEPDPHAVVLLAEEHDVADAFDASQSVLELDRGIVAQVKLVVNRPARVRVFVGAEREHQQQVGGALLDIHADRLDHLRQGRLGHGDAVLHQDLRHVDVGPQGEGHIEGVGAVVVALRRHVQHPLDAHDLLLDGGRHGVRDHLGIRAGIAGSHLHRRRRDVGVLGDRQ
jgi:hypothetical protein